MMSPGRPRRGDTMTQPGVSRSGAEGSGQGRNQATSSVAPPRTLSTSPVPVWTHRLPVSAAGAPGGQQSVRAVPYARDAPPEPLGRPALMAECSVTADSPANYASGTALGLGPGQGGGVRCQPWMLIVGAAVVTSCAAGTERPARAPRQYSIGGAVSGLAGVGLVLQDTGADDLAVNSNGSFVFPRPVAEGRTYSVTVKTQPTSPSQACTVSNGVGTVGIADVTTVAGHHHRPHWYGPGAARQRC